MPKSLFIDPDKMRAEGKITFQDIPINTYKKSVQEELDEGNYTKEDLIRIFRDMTICREFEDMLNQIKTQARYADVETTYPGPAHLSLGQEAAAVGEAYLLNREDFTRPISEGPYQLTVSGVTTAITWTSSDTSVATVSSSGLVTPVGSGTATITASWDGQSLSCIVRVP